MSGGRPVAEGEKNSALSLGKSRTAPPMDYWREISKALTNQKAKKKKKRSESLPSAASGPSLLSRPRLLLSFLFAHWRLPCALPPPAVGSSTNHRLPAFRGNSRRARGGRRSWSSAWAGRLTERAGGGKKKKRAGRAATPSRDVTGWTPGLC